MQAGLKKLCDDRTQRLPQFGDTAFAQSNDPVRMNTEGTISIATWLNVAMLFMNLAVWVDNALRLAG